MAKFHVRRLPFMFPVVVVLGFIIWKWANGSDSADPNLDCRIGSKMFADGSSHCFTAYGNLVMAEVWRDYVALTQKALTWQS